MKRSGLILFVLFFLSFQALFAATITSVSSGDWNNAATWDAGVPTSSDDVVIATGHTVTLNDNATVLSLTLNGTGSLVIGNDATARNLTVTGTTTINGSITVGAFDITHTVNFQGAVTNNGTLDFYNSSSQSADVVFDNTFSFSGNTPEFARVIFNSGTRTAAVAFDINGSVTIENGATFADGDFTHTVAGNWTENGTGQMTGSGTIQMDASLIQSVTANATFNNLTYNGGGIGVLGADVTVAGDFHITNTTEVKTSQSHSVQGDFTIDDNSEFNATDGTLTLNSTSTQTLTIGTTDSEPNATFDNLYFDNGTTNHKTVDGNIVSTGLVYVYTDAILDDVGDDKIHQISNFRIDGTCNFSGTIHAMGGTFYDDSGDHAGSFDSEFSVGTADIIVFRYLYVGSNDEMTVNGDLTVGDDSETYGSHLVVNNGSQLIGIAGKTLLVKDDKSIYIRDVNNFPTGFGTITLEELSYARFDRDIANQNIPSRIYGRLYLNHGTDKTALGSLDIESNLYVYNGTELLLGDYDHTVGGHIANSDDSWGNGSITATGGSLTLDAADANQYIYDAGNGTYTFHDLIFTNTAPTAARQKRLYNDIIVNGNFSVTNTGGSVTNRLYVYMYENDINGGGSGNGFSLGENVWLMTSGETNFETAIGTFDGTVNFHVNSTVRFDRTDNGSYQSIPGGFTYGNIELRGSNEKRPATNLDIDGNISLAGYTPVFKDGAHAIHVAGNWELSQSTTELTGGTMGNYIYFDGADQDISSSNFNNVIFEGSGTKTISGNLNILNDLEINSGVTVDAGERYIYIDGNWDDSKGGEFNQIGAAVVFDGSSADQTVASGASSYFYNLTIDKSGTNKKLTFGSDIDVNGTLDFTEDNAELDLAGNNLYVANGFNFREGCTFTHNNGKVFFDGSEMAQLIRNYHTDTIVFANVEFVGSAVKRLYNNSFRFEGNVSINNSTLDGQHWDHYVEGNWNNTGVFRHSRTLHFNGSKNQTISQSSFHSIRIGDGDGNSSSTYTKTLTGDISLTGHLYIDDATLDVSGSNYDITLDDYWHNDSTGSFMANQGTVTFTGEWNYLYTGESNTQYNSGSYLTTQGGTKDFYNLTINCTNEDHWLILRGDLHVDNNFIINEGDFRQSYDPNNYGINDIYIGGDFISKGQFRNNNYGDAVIELNASPGDYIFDPGSTNEYSIINFTGTGSYDFESNLQMYNDRALTVAGGELDLNSYKITTVGNHGDINLTGGTIEVDSAAVFSVGANATFTNSGGTLKLTGHSDDPASLVATSGNFIFTQTSGTIHANNYRIEGTSGNGIDIQGGSIDASNTFQNGSFAGGIGTAYLTTSGIDLGGNRTINSVSFNSGPSYNVQRTSGNGEFTFENAVGTLAGEDYDNDPGTFVNWTYPGAAYWDGNSDGDGDNIHWNDALNWATDAVPTSGSIVILNHDNVSAAYTVDLSGTAAGVAKSLMINSGSNTITLDLNGQELTISEDITIGSNSVLEQSTANDTIKIGGSWSNEGTFNEGTSAVIFNPVSGTHTISTQGAADPFHTFIINGTGGTNVVSSNLNIDGDVELSGGTLNAGTNTITVAGDWSRNGGTINVGTSTVDFDNSGSQSINGGEFYNFIISGSGTKTATANIDIDNDIDIEAGAVFAGGTNIIYVGDDWDNQAGTSGFTQSGAGTVIFDFDGWTQHLNGVTTFNHLRFSDGAKQIHDNITVNGNLTISAGYLYIDDGADVTGTGGGTFTMSGGNLRLMGHSADNLNNFPSGFGTINLSAGRVEYYADFNQTVYPTTYYNLRLRSPGIVTNTKTLTGDITVNGNVTVYDVETLFDVNDYTINLQHNLSFPENGRQIDWGPDGTLIHFGEWWTVDGDIDYLNNVVKKNHGYMRVIYKSLEMKGDLSILEDAYLQQDTVNITCSGIGKTFTLAATAYVNSYNPETLGTSSGRKAFPVDFATYNLHKDSRVYIRGTVGDQEIYCTPNYGHLYLWTHSEINQTLDGNLDIEGDLRSLNELTLVDGGYNINIAGEYIDIRKYTPSGTSTMTFDGADQRIVDAGAGATEFNMNDVVFAGSGQKSLHYSGDDWYNVAGDLTINSGVTVYIPRRLDFSGSTWTNNGIFNHTRDIVNFNGSSAQSINPGVNNDFESVNFTGATKTFTGNGINVDNGSFIIEVGANNLDMGSGLTHYIASERITENSGTWITSNAHFVFDRNGTQYLPAMTCEDLTFRRYDQWNRVRYLEGDINVDDLTIEEGTQLRCAENNESLTNYDVIVRANFINNGRLYAYGNTFDFENTGTYTETIIKQGNGSFDYVVFNQQPWGDKTRIYTLTEETRFYEDLTIGKNATLDLNGQILHLGNNDPNDPTEPDAESLTIQSAGTLEVDEGSVLDFSCRDNGNPLLDVQSGGTLKIVGTDGNNALITSTDWYTNLKRIDININSGAEIHAQYYLMKYIVDDGFYVDAGATVDNTNNFSNGTWSELNTAGGVYLECNATVTNSVDDVTFNYSGTPTQGTHFNVKRASGNGTMAFGGSISGLLAGEDYEADPTGVTNPGVITWPAVVDYYWTGAESTDWFTANNWSPSGVPNSLRNAIIPMESNNPIITGSNAVCKNLQITTGFLTLQSGYNLTVSGDVYVGSGTDVGILAVEDASCTITVDGSWTRAQNSLFVHGNGTVSFEAGGGSVSIDPRDSEFGDIVFNGGASFLFTRQENFVDGDFTITSGTVYPSNDNYKLHIKGNYNKTAGGTFDNSTEGTVLFDGSGAQTITNGIFWHVEIDGSGTKSTVNACTIDGELNVKNGTFQGGETIDMNDDVTVESSGTFNDGGFTHTFSGRYWTGIGAYTGTGTIEFDRDGYQRIYGGKFNNLYLKNNGSVTLYDNVDMTGDLTLVEPNTYINVDTYQLDNTSGTGTFSMGDNRRIYIRGASNFPVNFATYSFHENSYSFYDGTMAQTIASVPVIYGRLYLDNSAKTAGGHLDIDGILYFYDDASLDITASNYRINIEGDWYNYYGATFYPHEGEVIFDGNNDYTYLRIYEESKDSNPFYDLTVNKSAGEVRSYWTDITIQNDLRVINGIMYQDETMFVGGNMSALSGTFAATGTYYLQKPSGSSNLQLNGSLLHNLTVNSGAEYTLQDDMEMNGIFNLIAGTFDANGQTVTMGNYGESNQISGIYKVGAGGILRLPNYGSLTVNSGGEIYIVGEADNIATVTNNDGRYYFYVESGGTIRARNYLFEYMAENGVYVKDGGIIHNDYNFSYGTFTNPATGGTCLRIENLQDFTEAGGNAVYEVSFPNNPGGGTSNVTKTTAVGGQLDFKDYSGEFAGENYDNDPSDLINWISPPYVMWTGNIDNDWYKTGNWQVNAGPDRIPLITDNVVITKQTNQPVIDTDGALAKTLEVEENAYLTLNTTAATDTTLEVAGDFNFKGSVVMTSANDTLTVGGNWNNTGMFTAGQGSVIMNSLFGIVALDNYNDFFNNLYINSTSDIQLSRNTTVNNDFIIKNGRFDMANYRRVLTVKGDFYNNDNYVHQNSKLIFAGTNQEFDPGNSDFYNVDIDAVGTVTLTDNNLSMGHNLTVNSGIFDINNLTFNFGDASGTDVITLAGGTLNVDENAYLRLADNSSIEVNSGGTIILLGTDVDNPAYLQSQSGTFGFNVNSGGTIEAKYYNIQNTNTSGIRIKSGATIDGTNNFSEGVWRHGTTPGQYLWLENDFADFTATGVYFHGGASINAKRKTGSGVITFEDAIGLLAGSDYEDDDGAASTGLIRWVYTHDRYTWTGATDTQWNLAANWDVEGGGHAIPDNSTTAIIPDVSAGTKNNPNLQGANGTCYDLNIENGGYLTLSSNYDLVVDNTVTVVPGGTFDVNSGSVSQINVGDIWSIGGTFDHGGSSTVVFDAPAGKLLTISGNSSFYNFEINSTGNAEYMTGSSLNIDGDLDITSGVFTVSNSNDTLYVAGDFNNASTFNHGNGVLLFDGANQNISNTGTGNIYKLNCEGSQTKTITSNLSIEGDLDIKTGATLSGASHTLTLYGDWINRGTFTPSAGTVVFGGSSTQLLDNYNKETFYDFSLNNSASTFPQLILYGDVDVTGTSWTMTDGIIETSATEILTIGSSVVLSGGNTDASYISGPLVKIGSADFTFPIGDDTKFARLGISNLSGSETFTAEYHEAAYSDITVTGTLDHVSGYEHWTLNRAGSQTANVTFYWEDGAESGIDNLTTLTTAEYNNPAWEDRGNASTTGTVSAGSITSNSAFSIYGVCGFGSTDSDNPLNGYSRWTGQVSAVWNNPNNWSMGVPTATADALIPSAPSHQPVIDINAEVRKLTIDNGASLNVNPLKSLTTEGNFYINGTFRLNSDATGNAALINKAPISYGGSSDIVTELYLSADAYHYVSSPTTSTHTARFKDDPYAPYYNTNFYEYIETESTWNILNADWVEYTGILPDVKGYAFYVSGAITVQIDADGSNAFNTGSKASGTLTYTGNTEANTDYRGWNIVGNPYPAHIDWDAASGWTKTNIYNSVYFWDDSQDNYAYYVSGSGGVNGGTNIIPPMQGFMVKVQGSDDNNYNGSVTVTEDARTTTTQAYWKNKELKDEIDVIRIHVSGNDKNDETAVNFNENATPEFDSDFDAFKIFPGEWYGVPQIYSVLSENSISAINTLPGYYDELIIPIGFQTPLAGTYTIDIPEFVPDKSTEIYFEDIYEDEIFEISSGLNYFFSSEDGQFDDRFRIFFAVETTENDDIDFDDVSVRIFSYENTIYLKSDTKNAVLGNVQIYNILGSRVKEIINTETGVASIQLNIPPGYYFVKLSNKYGVFTQKVFIQ